MTTNSRYLTLQDLFAIQHRGVSRVLLLVMALAIGSVGCSHIIKRGQSPDAEAMEFNEGVEEATYIGDVAGPVGLDKLKVEGLALVTALDGSGSDPAPSAQRDYLVDEIKTHEVENVNGLLQSTDNSLVQILGFVPPGAKKGDRFDIVVQCMPKSETTSLEGGYLMMSRMKPLMVTRRSVQMGHNFALAEGRVLINQLFDSNEQVKNMVSGIVPGGGIVSRERETGLQLLDSARSIQNTTAMARAINARFTTRVGSAPEGVANPVSDRRLEILIPDEYRHNIGRYFHVMLNIVFEETPDERINRLEMLERQLHDPSMTSISAIRLEAIGEEAMGALKRGLRSDEFQVRFHAAQALAYMKETAGVEVLREAVLREPAFRWHGLTGLASLQSTSSEKALAALFDSASAESRYGAFRALRESMPGSPLVDGEFVNREFMLHSVPSTAPPMIHFSRTRIPEIVMFGDDQRFGEDLLFIDKGLTIRADGPDHVQLMLYRPHTKPQKVVCSSSVEDVIRHAVALGCDYGDILKLVKDAGASNALSSRLVINALPSLNSSYRAGVQPGESDDMYASEELPDMFDDSSGAANNGNAGERSAKGIFGRLDGLWKR